MNYKILLSENPDPSDVQVLGDGIIAYAKQKKGMAPIRTFAFFIRDENGQIMGGCKGDILYGCMFVSDLWVSEGLRNKGYGSKLMDAAEQYGKEKGCLFAAVNTMDWEALNFYKKLGFYIEFERHGFEKNSIFYFLRKDFNNES